MQKKTRSLPIVHATLATLLISLAIPALAHEGRTSTSPKDGDTVQDSPAKIGIEFGDVMRITQFEARMAQFPLMVSQVVNRSNATS